jgi:hypothetical protein
MSTIDATCGGACCGNEIADCSDLVEAHVSFMDLQDGQRWPDSASNVPLTFCLHAIDGPPATDCPVSVCDPTYFNVYLNLHAPLDGGPYVLIRIPDAEGADPCSPCYETDGMPLCEILTHYGYDAVLTCNPCEVEPEYGGRFAYLGTTECSCTDSVDPFCTATILIDAWIRMVYCVHDVGTLDPGQTGCLSIEWLYYIKVENYYNFEADPFDCSGNFTKLIHGRGLFMSWPGGFLAQNFPCTADGTDSCPDVEDGSCTPDGNIYIVGSTKVIGAGPGQDQCCPGNDDPLIISVTLHTASP